MGNKTSEYLERVKELSELFDVTAADLAGIYGEVAEAVGIDNAYELFQHFRGQQLVFPLKFYSKEFMNKQIREEYNGKNVRALAKKYGYSESRVRQILRNSQEVD